MQIRQPWRRLAYLHGGTGGKLIQQVIDPFKPRELRPKPDKYRVYKPRKLLEFDTDGVMLLYSYKHRWTQTLKSFLTPFLPFTAATGLLVTDPWPCRA